MGNSDHHPKSLLSWKHTIDFLYLTALLFVYFTEGDAAAVKGGEESTEKIQLKDQHNGQHEVLKEMENDGKLAALLSHGYYISDIRKRRIGETNGETNNELAEENEDVSRFSTNGALGSDDMNELAVEVTVNKTGVTMKVDGNMVYSCLNKTMTWGNKLANLCEGIHLITLNQVTGHLMRAELYMTWQSTSEDQLVAALKEIQDGRLLVIIGKPDFTTDLALETIADFINLGSYYADSLATTEIWCFVVYKGGRTVLEHVTMDSITNKKPMRVSPLHLHFTVSRMEGLQCEWYGQVGLEEKEDFCETYGGYGAFCSCHGSPWNPEPTNDFNFPINEVIPVAIITARRLTHVLRQVTQIWSSPGGSKTPIDIFVDGKNPEAQALGKLLNISVVEDDNPISLATNQSENTPMMSQTKRISYHIRFSMLEAFRRHPQVDKVIILEDDLDLAPDFISYFHQTAPLLSSDKKLMCVNAYNYNAFNHTAYDPARLYRTHGVPAYGWMTTREKALEMANKWAFANQSVDWDLWLRSNMMEDVIIPEIPRTKHIGGGGTHVSGLEQLLYYNQRPINKIANVTIDVKSADAETYLLFHLDAISKAKVLRFTDHHPCNSNPIPTHKVNETYVIYVYQPDESNSSQALYVACRCFGLNDRSLHENLMMMATVPFFENQLYIIGCPNSPFCIAKDPDDIYHASPEDVSYADNKPFRKITLTNYYSQRVPPLSWEETMELGNLMQYQVNGVSG